MSPESRQGIVQKSNWDCTMCAFPTIVLDPCWTVPRKWEDLT